MVNETRSCTQCGFEGDIDEFFGWVHRHLPKNTTDNRAQPWCFTCRNGKKTKVEIPTTRQAVLRLFRSTFPRTKCQGLKTKEMIAKLEVKLNG